MNQLDVEPAKLFARYQDLQRYVDWCDEDTARVRAAGQLLQPYFEALVDDFYDEISRHPDAHRVITGGQAQIDRLRKTLYAWLAELLSGNYDEAYVARRWRVGLRHVEIGLSQVYTNVALSRLRNGLLTALEAAWQDSEAALRLASRSLNKQLDLDLAIIEDAYQSAHLERQQRTERLITIGQMAGGVAHELRNPLNVVKTSVYYLLNAKNTSPEKIVEHLRRIERQVGLADKVITALSDFAKLPFPEVRPTPLHKSVDEAIEISALPPGIEVSVAIPENLSPVLADPDQLQIVLTNLIRNAGDAMQAGGRLTVTAIELEEHVDLSIADTGAGIPHDALRRIMEPLYSTKARGLGLGLAVARAIIDKHHGQIRVTSESGKGSNFTVRLPTSHAKIQPTIE